MSSDSRTIGTRLMAIAILAVLAGNVQAAEPQISLIEPPGMQRGTEADIVIRGDRLADAKELLFYRPGLSIKQITPDGGKTLKVRIAAAADCPPGIRVLRVRTDTGISNLWSFAVGVLPEIAEVEPNSEFTSPQPIALDTTVNGVTLKEDVDYYVVEAKQGERITAELEGMRLANAFFDPYAAILNESQFELVRSDDAALLGQDPVCSIIAPADGRYYIQVRDSAFEGSDRCKYRLHVGRFPRPAAIVPSGGRPGETLQVKWLGDVAGAFTSQVTLPAREGIPKLEWQNVPLPAQNESGWSPSPVCVRISDLDNVVEVEPNNDVAGATPLTVPAAANGVIEPAGDLDRFKFTAIKGQALDIRVFARRVLRSPLDSVLRIRDSTGKSLIGNDDSGAPDSYVRFAPPADGEYILEVQDHLRSGGPDFGYRVEVTPVQPRLIMTLPERVRYFSTTLTVPSGNRTALMVTMRRENWAGDVKVDFQGLPAGLTAQTVPMAASRTEIPVVFHAAADAAPSGGLVEVVGRPVDEKLKLEGHLQQRTMLVRGQNNRDVWGHDADRMATAVGNPVPFTIDLVAPQAPLVRNGSMQLKVVAKRKEGFTGAIAVRMLYNPPGVASSRSISIPADKNETIIPLTANGSAGIQVWPIVVIGSAAVASGGRAEVATQLVDLEVADHFFELAFGKAAVEQGKVARLPIKITQKREFEGTAKVQIVGLPAGATCEPLEFNKDATELELPIATAEDARVGRHRTVMCRAVVTVNGEPVMHTLGTGEVRIDRPRPAPQQQIAEKKPAPAPKPAPVKALSRLEQLRQQRSASGEATENK